MAFSLCWKHAVRELQDLFGDREWSVQQKTGSTLERQHLRPVRYTGQVWSAGAKKGLLFIGRALGVVSVLKGVHRKNRQNTEAVGADLRRRRKLTL